MNHLKNLKAVIELFFSELSNEVFVVRLSDYDHQESLGVFATLEDAKKFLLDEKLVTSLSKMTYNSNWKSWVLPDNEGWGKTYVVEVWSKEKLHFLYLSFYERPAKK